MNEFSWIKLTNRSIVRNNSYAIHAIPTLEQLDKFICDHMLNTSRYLTISTTDYTDEGAYTCHIQKNEHKQFINLITELSLKYYPWQFRTLVQKNGQAEIDWTEVEEWRNKYEQ